MNREKEGRNEEVMTVVMTVVRGRHVGVENALVQPVPTHGAPREMECSLSENDEYFYRLGKS